MVFNIIKFVIARYFLSLVGVSRNAFQPVVEENKRLTEKETTVFVVISLFI